MYLDFDVVRASLDELSAFHPFFGMTFLVCKEAALPVGHAATFEINNDERDFLDTYYKPDPASSFYFQPFRTSARYGRWLAEKYPSSGSQSTRTKGDFAAAFIHEKNTKLWGWQPNYVSVLARKLHTDRTGRIPVFWLAVWLYRNQPLNIATADDLVKKFLDDYSITVEEREELFRLATPEIEDRLWSDLPYRDAFLMKVVEPPPDASADVGATLRRLQIRGTGPVDMDMAPADRLSIVTGDNGLGKSFILETAWWALTGSWSERPAVPRIEEGITLPPQIRVSVSNENADVKPQIAKYDPLTTQWIRPVTKKTIPGLVLYARVDGSFAIWDPLRHEQADNTDAKDASIFTREQILNGERESGIEGLIRDWVSWQRDKTSETFSLFTRVLRKLSPPDMAPLIPGEPRRLPGKDSRTIPTIQHDYGSIPITLESAGVKRVITLAYFLVWAWNEHKIAAGFKNKEVERNLVVLIDEMESHLHPKWQRVVLPALLDVLTYLSENLQTQMIIATHSPLVLASCEEIFSDTVDKLFHLSLRNSEVRFQELPFVAYGTVDSWLQSDIFNLSEARSKGGESAVVRARRLMAEDAPNTEEVLEVNRDLVHVLPEDDELWVRWIFFAKFRGIEF